MNEFCGDWPTVNPGTSVLVVNPLQNWWNLAFTAEMALQMKGLGAHVDWLDLGAGAPTLAEVDSKHRVPKWRYRDPSMRLARILAKHGIGYVSIEADSVSNPLFSKPPNVTLIDWAVDGRPVGRVIDSAIRGLLRVEVVDPDRHKRAIQILADEYSRAQRVMQKALLRRHYDLMITTNDRLLGAAVAVAEARAAGIEHRVAYWGSSVDSFMLYRNSLYAPDDWRRHVALKWQTQPPTAAETDLLDQEIISIGQGGMTETAQYRLSMRPEYIDIDRSRKKVLAYFPSSLWESSGLVPWPPGTFQSQPEAVSALLEVLDPQEWDVIVRHHPGPNGRHIDPDLSQWSFLDDFQNVTQWGPNSGVDSYALAERADVVCVWGSTIGLESLAKGRPTLVLGSPFWCSDSWGIGARTPSALSELLEGPLPVPRPADLRAPFWFLHAHGMRMSHVSGLGMRKLMVEKRRVFIEHGWLCWLPVVEGLLIRLRNRFPTPRHSSSSTRKI